jgi:transposase
MMVWTAPNGIDVPDWPFGEVVQTRRPSMEKAIMIGIDTAKNVFEVCGRDASGAVVLRRRLKRSQVEGFFASLPKATIGLEACGSAHHWGRLLVKLGHEVRLMPPAYVKPYVKRNKNDTRDAAACCEAMGRPEMRFVRLKTVEQQASLSLHRARELLVSQRTQLGNALRSLLAEFGIVAGTGKSGLAGLMSAVQAGELELPEAARLSASTLAGQRIALEAAIGDLDRRIIEEAKACERMRMLRSAPGVGPMSAHATVATMPDPAVFASGRNFAAWLGLTPREHSSGQTRRLGGITKRGDKSLRRRLVLGATAWLRQVRIHPEKASPWLRGMLARRPIKVVAVAQAAHTARILWAMLTHNQPYRTPTAG